MPIPLWCAVLGAGNIAAPRLAAEESAGLILLAASLLVFRTFRERYLLIWILGWLAYFDARWTVRGLAEIATPTYLTAICQAEFVLAVALFAAAVLVYCHRRKLLLPLALGTLGLMVFAVGRALLFPASAALRGMLEISYRLIALLAAFQVIRFRWARWEMGSWMLGASLLLLHLDWAPLSVYLPPQYNLILDIMFGMSILVIVFDDSRMHTRRLNVIHALTTSIARADKYAPMTLTALEQLQSLMLSKAAWFRLVEGDHMILSQQIGLSKQFLAARDSVPLDDKFESTLDSESAIVVKTSQADDSVRPYLEAEKFHHCVLVPVRGKKSVIGVLILGSAHRFSYAPDEIDFLTASGHQLGLAVENLRLVEQILRSHRQWSNTFDSIPDMVLVHDAEFRVMKANHALLARLAQSPADLAGKPCEDVLPHDQGVWKGCPYCEASADGFLEGPDRAFGGHSMASTSFYMDHGSKQKATIHVVRDTSDRRMAEEKYRQLFEQVQEGVFVATPEGQLLDCNEAFVQMLGYDGRDELTALNVDSDLYASPEQRAEFRRQVEANNYVRNFEVMLRRKNGSLLTAMESSFATRDISGKIERYQGFLLDITEKKRAEDEIRRRNRELNALNAMAVIATQSFDLDEILNLTLRQVISLLGAESGSIYLSDLSEDTFRCRALWGQRSAGRGRKGEVRFAQGFGELVTRSRTEVITDDYLPHLPADVADFVRAGEVDSCIWILLWGKDKPIGIMGLSSTGERQYSSNDENLLVAISRQLATTIEKVRLYEESCRAYDDLRQTQEKLLQSEKMSAVGQLISGVAHELNNPLTAILGYAQLLESEGLNEKATDFVGKLFKQAQRTHRVVQNLLSFARQRKSHRHEVDVCKVLEETLALRDYDLRLHDIQLLLESDVEVPAVKADPHQLEQVFLNIVNNSMDAMLEQGRGGTLRIRVRVQDGKVSIEFQDSGPGIKEPSRIFEPFYTTKGVGKGTGLGLSICYGIIKEHEGEIVARNRAEGGGIIEILLPSAGAVSKANEAPFSPRRDTAIEGRILLVEDEAPVLEFERDVLEGAGAQIIAFSNCEEMSAHLLRSPVDALIVNGMMAGGWDVKRIHDWLAQHCPGTEIRLLFTFSSVPTPDAAKFLQENGTPHLMKPFDVGELIAHAKKLTQKTHAEKTQAAAAR